MANDSKVPPNSPFGIPGASNLHGVMESMQKAWGFAGAQPMAPTLNLEEIDQRLKDLNAVSQWLSLNQNMLQSSIQALQVQRATIVAIKSFSGDSESPGTDAAAMTPMALMQAFSQAFSSQQSASAPESAAPAAAGSPAAAGADPQQWWAMLQEQFAQVASAALNTTDAKPEKAAKPKPKSPTRPSKK